MQPHYYDHFSQRKVGRCRPRIGKAIIQGISSTELPGLNRSPFCFKLNDSSWPQNSLKRGRAQGFIAHRALSPPSLTLTSVAVAPPDACVFGVLVCCSRQIDERQAPQPPTLALEAAEQDQGSCGSGVSGDDGPRRWFPGNPRSGLNGRPSCSVPVPRAEEDKNNVRTTIATTTIATAILYLYII